MSYLSIARKYRPRRFVDMVGQEATTLALTNAIRLKREPRCVIFTGVRGIGKTTTARIYAKALNCESGPTADPCDHCESCLAIQDGAHEDVLEIDGASNTGVDDVRALQETLAYVPQRSSYKIYIIDEVHMLSISAFNALLKTLEEPPEHVIFIFATTELHKVPETIQSRCQTFHLQKISQHLIEERLKSILETEGLSFDSAALPPIAREGRGSLRDALTLLDQAIAVGGGVLSREALKNLAGNSDVWPVLELLSALVDRNAAKVLSSIGEWDQSGREFAVLVEELATACRNAFILRDMKPAALDVQLLDIASNEREFLSETAKRAAPLDINRMFRTWIKCLDDLRHAELDRFVVENYALEWCLDPGLPEQLIPHESHRSAMHGNSNPIESVPSHVAGGLPKIPVATEPTLGLKERWRLNQAQVAPELGENIGKPVLANTSASKRPPPLSLRADMVASVQSPVAPADKTSDSLPIALAEPVEKEEQLSYDTNSPFPTPLKAAPEVSVLSAESSKAEDPKESQSEEAAGHLAESREAAGLHPSSLTRGAVTRPPASALHVPLPSPSLAHFPPSTGLQGYRAQAVKEPPLSSVTEPVHQVDAKSENLASPRTDVNSPLAFEQPNLAPTRARSNPSAPLPSMDDKAPNQQSSTGPSLPPTWREFVDAWKREKPLQARVVEETYVLEYSAECIRLAVDPQSMAGGKLLQIDMRKRFLAQFEQLFGFHGQLEVVPKSEVRQGQSPESLAPLGESLLEVKQKEREIAREQLKQRLEQHPITREVISKFGGTIENIDLP